MATYPFPFRLSKPCSNCPFAKGNGSKFRLHEERIGGILNADGFTCHKTVDYTSCDDDGTGRTTGKSQQCAGLIAVLRNEGLSNLSMQLGERLLDVDFSTFDPDGQVTNSVEQMLEAHISGMEPKGGL